MKELVLRGVPRRLERDGWWLTDASQAEPTQVRPAGDLPVRAGLGAALVALALWLFYGQPAGVSIVVMAVALGAAMTWIARDRPLSRIALAWLVLGLGALPMAERIQGLSLGFLAMGLCAAAVILNPGADLRGAGFLGALGRFGLTIPQAAMLDLLQLRARPRAAGTGARTYHAARLLALPTLAVVVLGFLLVIANPRIEQMLRPLFQTDLRSLVDVLVFSAVAALLIWPFVAHQQLQPAPALPRGQGPIRGGALVNAGSITLSLVLLNLVMAVQTLSDLLYLWLSHQPPRGMTLAEYAHRGAYPLVVTALLAGLFAMLSRPFATGRAVRLLLAVWVVQNIALVVSAAARLDFYVRDYGLTPLRVQAAVWMLLVAGGLLLTLWQVFRRRTNGWLFARIYLMALTVLYGCTFVNAGAMIADVNLTRSESGQGLSGPDRGRICALRPDAAHVIRHHETVTGQRICPPHDSGSDGIYGHSADHRDRVSGWRDWGFRKWRIRRYLTAHPAPERA